MNAQETFDHSQKTYINKRRQQAQPEAKKRKAAANKVLLAKKPKGFIDQKEKYKINLNKTKEQAKVENPVSQDNLFRVSQQA